MSPRRENENSYYQLQKLRAASILTDLSTSKSSQETWNLFEPLFEIVKRIIYANNEGRRDIVKLLKSPRSKEEIYMILCGSNFHLTKPMFSATAGSSLVEIEDLRKLKTNIQIVAESIYMFMREHNISFDDLPIMSISEFQEMV